MLDPDEEEQKDEKQKKRGSGFTAPLPLSDALVKFFGTGETALSRADVVKRMWNYIKQNDLQVCGGYYMSESFLFNFVTPPIVPRR